MMQPTQLTEVIESLSPDERQRVELYVSFILKEHTAKSKGAELRFDWAGGLSSLKGQYNAIGLQKQAMGWMSGSPG
jgi:hypothetical protein